MPTPAPRLAPIFRSKTQLEILTALFVIGGTYSLTELAERTSISLPLVSREITRLEQGGLVTSRPRGQLELVQANEDHPSAAPLRQLLDRTAGASHHLRSLIAEHQWAHIDRAVIFGSWARRFHGDAGAAPNDLDVLLVSSVLISVRETMRSSANSLRDFPSRSMRSGSSRRTGPTRWLAPRSPTSRMDRT